MSIETAVYWIAGAFLCGVILGYWLRKRLPTVADLQERMQMEDELMRARLFAARREESGQ